MKFQWIKPETQKFDPKTQQPASYIRKEFTIEKPVRKATAYMTAMGCYIPYLNGERLSDRLLLPGFTDYTKRVQVQEYDVTGRLRVGKNAVGCVVGDGWYRGNLGAFNKRNVYGTALMFACTIIAETDDGTVTIQSGADWKATQNGPLRENDLKLCEIYDARKEMPGWAEAGFDDSGWHACVAVASPCSEVADEGETVTEHERFPANLLHTPDGNTVLDFGQNLAGHVRFTVSGQAGTSVSLTMGEALDESGNFTLANLQGTGRSAEVMCVGQKLIYVLKEGQQTYTSHFLISGYRYVLLENWPEEVRAENFASVAIYSDLRTTGTFECSNPLINRFVQNVMWSLRSNFVDIPTDCPQRERAGWTGDISVFIDSANYLVDTRKFLRKWLRDLAGMQKPSGEVPVIAPTVPLIGVGSSSAGWSDAIATVPFAQYWAYEDKELLREIYPFAKRWVDFNEKRAKKRNILNFPKKWFREKYVLDTGFHFGEWLEPGGDNLKDGLKAFIHPDYEAATAWFYYSAKIVSDMAEVLGEKEDQKKYRTLASKIETAYQQYFLPTGNVVSLRQCKYVRPLYMGLAAEGEAQEIAERLNDLARANQYKIGTGFMTTYQVLNVLTDFGYAETAYKMMENESCPGWLYEVKQGATTVWEGWDAIRDGKLKPLSLNHYAPGAAVSWLFSRCAGIRPLKPGYQEVLIKPVPGGSLTYAKASYESIAGMIRSSWKIENGEFILNIEIPNGLWAKVELPDGTIYDGASSNEYRCPWNHSGRDTRASDG